MDIDFIARPGQDSLSIRRTVDAILAEQMALPRIAAFVSGESAVSFDQALAQAAAVADEVGGIQVATTVAGEPSVRRASSGQFDLGAQQQLMLFMFLTSLAGSAALVQTRRLGIARRMFATPTSVRTILLGEGLGRFAVALVQGVYIMLGTMLMFGVRWGDPFSAILIVVAFGLVGSGAAMLMGALFSNDQQAAPVGVFLGLGTAALGGCMLPLYVMELFAPGRVDRSPHHAARLGAGSVRGPGSRRRRHRRRAAVSRHPARIRGGLLRAGDLATASGPHSLSAPAPATRTAR